LAARERAHLTPALPAKPGASAPLRVSAKEPINRDELTSERPRRGPLGKTQRYDESRFFVKD